MNSSLRESKAGRHYVDKHARIAEDESSVSVNEFFDLEDMIANSLDWKTISERFSKESLSLLNELTSCAASKEPASEELRDRVLCRFMNLRRLNRFAQYRNRQTRIKSTTERINVEENFLQLQNITSEIEHLHKEIARCYDFKSADENIELIPIEEFYSTAPAAVTNEENTRNDEHAQRSARLVWEMTERKSLLSTLQELEGRKSVLKSDIKTKEHRIKSLKPKLDAVITASKAIQDLMGYNVELLYDYERYQMYEQLPKELAALAVQIDALCEINGDKGVKVYYEGDVFNATKFNEAEDELLVAEKHETYKIRELNDDKLSSSCDASEKNNIFKELEKRKSCLTKPHPMRLLIEVKCPEDISATLILQFIPQLHCVGVHAKLTSPPLPFYGNILSENSILIELFENDNGEKCPNAVGQAKLENFNITVEDYQKSIGRMYKFAQQMAGLCGSSTDRNSMCNVIQSTIHRLRIRLLQRSVLLKSIHSLCSSRLFDDMAPDERNHYPSKIFSTIEKFDMISHQDFFSHRSVPFYQRLIDSERRSSVEDCFYFETTIRRANATLLTLIFVDVTYPEVPPLYILEVRINGCIFNAQNSPPVNHLESLINAEYKCSEKKDSSNLLTLQLAFLVTRFDVLMEVNSNLMEFGEFPLEHPYPRLARGRDRQIPFIYNSTSNTFSFSSKINDI